MSKPIVTYSDYLGFGGKLDKESFDALLVHAVAEVGYLIGFNDVTSANEAAYKTAVCAALDSFGQTGTMAAQSFSVGSFSMSGGGESPNAAARRAAWLELVGSGLLYQGVGR